MSERRKAHPRRKAMQEWKRGRNAISLSTTADECVAFTTGFNMGWKAAADRYKNSDRKK